MKNIVVFIAVIFGFLIAASNCQPKGRAYYGDDNEGPTCEYGMRGCE